MPHSREAFAYPPPRRKGAQTLLFHPDDADGPDGSVLTGRRILLLEQPDRDTLGIPGGHALAGELVHRAAEREVLEETGLRITLTGADLLLIDHSPANPERLSAEGDNFLFNGGIVPSDQVAALGEAPADRPEISGYR